MARQLWATPPWGIRRATRWEALTKRGHGQKKSALVGIHRGHGSHAVRRSRRYQPRRYSPTETHAHTGEQNTRDHSTQSEQEEKR